ncbi:Formin protein 5 [Spatholobus suberectus]|nr:Formin protein 5 [Spatholobus suberectus]
MELTRPSYAVVYVILLCALAQGGSEGKGGKEEEFSTDSGALTSSIYVHGIKVENELKHCRKELIEKNNGVKDFDLHPQEGSSDMRTKENNIQKETKSLSLHMEETLDCIRTSTTPPASVSEKKGSSRYLLTKHSESTLGVERGHGRNLIADSPNNQMAPSPSAAVGSPSHGPTPASSPSSLTPSSRTPRPQGVDLPLPPDMFVPFPPLPHVPHPPPQKSSRPIAYAPVPSPPSKDDKKRLTVIIAATISGVIILIGLVLCYREARSNKADRDDRPLLVVTSSDYSGGSDKVVRLGDSDKEESDIGNGKNPSNVRNWSIKGGDNKASLIGTTASEGVEQVPVLPNGKPAPPPPGPPPPPPPKRPPPPAPRAPPPPRGAHPPPAPPKPMAGRNQGPLLSKEGSSSEGDAPKPKLKPFFWDKVNAKPDQSMVWHEISAGSFVINEEMMESLFGCTNQHKNERKKDSPSVDTSVHYIQIIDPKKAQNLSILLRALNVTTEEVIDALKEGNEIPVELIQTLLKMAPTTEEELKLRLFTGQLSELGPAERFLKVLVDIPFAFKRLESLMFMFILQEEFQSTKDSFATLEVACNELRKSRLFLKLLEAVLKTGNRMNDGTYRGGAQAFRLDTLLKLSDVKGTDGKTTLLHFVVQEIIRSEGIRAVRTERASRSISSVGLGADDSDEGTEESEDHYRSLGLQVVSGLSTELEDVKKAALVDGDALSAAVSKLGHSMAKTQEFLNTDMKSLGEESEFRRSMERFMDKAREEVTWLVEEEKRIMALVKSTADYFHGNAGRDEGLRLFLIVRDFLIILDKVCREVRDTTVKLAKASSNSKKEATSSVSPPDSPGQHSQPPPPPSDLHRRLFPAIAERRVDYSSSDDDEEDF